jgi:hypothetical protein
MYCIFPGWFPHIMRLWGKLWKVKRKLHRHCACLPATHGWTRGAQGIALRATPSARSRPLPPGSGALAIPAAASPLRPGAGPQAVARWLAHLAPAGQGSASTPRPRAARGPREAALGARIRPAHGDATRYSTGRARQAGERSDAAPQVCDPYAEARRTQPRAPGTARPC